MRGDPMPSRQKMRSRDLISDETDNNHRAIQNSRESLRALAKRYGINQKTVAKWKLRERPSPISRQARGSQIDSAFHREEAVIVAFRRHTLLPLDDCLFDRGCSLQDPHRSHLLTDNNGIQFTFPPRYSGGPTARYVTHMFDMRCQENGIEHRLTKIKHP
jgi:hypothetical protein